MRASQVALFAAFLLTLSAHAASTSTHHRRAPAALTATVTPSHFTHPAPEAVSFLGLGLLAVGNLTRRNRLARSHGFIRAHTLPRQRPSGSAVAL